MNKNESPNKLAKQHRLLLYKFFAYFLLFMGWLILTLSCVGLVSLVIYCINLIDMPERIDAYWQWIVGTGLSTIIVSCFALIRHLKPDNFHKFGIKIYRKLSNAYTSSENVLFRRLIMLIINIFFKDALIKERQQIDIVDKILGELKDNDNPKYLIVCGPAHSGKTTLIYHLMHTLTMSENYKEVFEKISHEIYYYDMTDDANYVKHIVNNINMNFYSNALLIIDNTHCLSRKNLTNLVNALCNKPKDIDKTLLMTRDETILEIMMNNKHIKCNTINMRLNNEWNEIPNSHIEKKLIYIYKDNIVINQALDSIKNKNLIVHIYNISIMSATTYPKETRMILDLILFDTETVPYIFESVIFLCCACAFTGQIKAEVFKDWLKSKNYNTKHYHKLKRIFLRSNFVQIFANIKNDFLRIHEKVAQGYLLHFKEKRTDEVKNAVTEYFMYLANLKMEYNVKWYYEDVLNESETIRYNKFSKLMGNHQFVPMLSNIEFITKFFDKEECYWKILSVLNDRVGNYIKTFKYADLYFKKTNNLDMIFPLLQGNHNLYFNKDYQEYFEIMKKSDDTFLRFAINYWEAHIKIHKGTSSLNEFKQLIESNKSNFDVLLNNEYLGYHELRRCYFDYYRQFYIEGLQDIDDIKYIQNSALNKLLQDNIPSEFESYNQKFHYGHYAHYVALVQIAIYYQMDLWSENEQEIYDIEQVCKNLEYIYGENFKHKNISGNLVPHVKELAIQYYCMAMDAMKIRGDKTSLYVNLRIQELKGIDCSSEKEAEEILKVYDEFIEDAISNKVQEYVAYGHTYKLKLYLCLFVNKVVLDTNCDSMMLEKEYLMLAKKSLSKARDAHKLYHENNENFYTNLRLNLYEFLIELYETKGLNPKLKLKLNELEKQSKSYGIESGIIKRLKKLETVSPEILFSIFKYYPIILQ